MPFVHKFDVYGVGEFTEAGVGPSGYGKFDVRLGKEIASELYEMILTSEVDG